MLIRPARENDVLFLKRAKNFLKSKGSGKIDIMSDVKCTLTHHFYLNRSFTEESKRFVKYV